MRYPRLLYALGLASDRDRMTLTVRDKDGKERAVTLEAGAEAPTPDWVTTQKEAARPEPLTFKNREAPYWFEDLPDSKTVFFQYNAVRNDPKEPLAKFCDRLFTFIAEKDVERLVIDMRWNGGGNNFLNTPITHGLIRCDKINKKGKLFVI